MERTLWHYTDSGGAIGILSSDSLWATSLQHLNDTSELEYGLKLVVDTLGERARQVSSDARAFFDLIRHEVSSEQFRSRFFAACASTVDDDLSQWRAYGGSGGYSIGPDIDSLDVWGIVNPKVPDAPPEMTPTWSSRFSGLGQWRPVHYDHAEQIGSMTRYLDSASQSAKEAMAEETSQERHEELLRIHAGYLVISATLCKNPAFVAEREWRIVVADPGVDDCIRFRPGPFGITPYVALTPTPDGTPSYYGAFVTGTPGRLAVHGVRVGPSSQPGSAQNGMDRLLAETGHDVTAELSATPYRSPGGRA